MAENQVRLTYKEKVPVAAMREVLSIALGERLQGMTYEADKAAEVNHIKNELFKLCNVIQILHRLLRALLM